MHLVVLITLLFISEKQGVNTDNGGIVGFLFPPGMDMTYINSILMALFGVPLLVGLVWLLISRLFTKELIWFTLVCIGNINVNN